ncbi:MAG: TSUP family transporter [Bacteroidia bacterium]
MLIALLCLIAFLAGFTDAIVGGGGLIQLPVMFIAFPNWLPINVFATNRFANASGTLMAAIQYARKISINWKIVLITSAASMIAAFVGARTMQMISPDVFKPIVLFVLIAVALYTYSKKEFGVIGNDEHVNTLHFLYPVVIGLLIGFYNGFIGPGTGSFLMFAFIGLLRYDFLKASASSKVINFATDFSTLVYFAYAGAIDYKIALPMAVFNIAGGYTGSHLAMLRGSKFVRIFFIIIVCVVIIRFAYDIFHV